MTDIALMARTPGERAAYRQGHAAGLRLATERLESLSVEHDAMARAHPDHARAAELHEAADACLEAATTVRALGN